MNYPQCDMVQNGSPELLGSILLVINLPQCDMVQNGSPELLGSILLVMN